MNTEIGAGVSFFATTQHTPPPKLTVNVAPSLPPASKVGQLGDYSQPAPGASVEILPEPDDR